MRGNFKPISAEDILAQLTDSYYTALAKSFKANEPKRTKKAVMMVSK